MRRLVALAVTTALFACVRSELVPCGAIACPVGVVCLEGVERCVSPNQLLACADKPAGAECVVDGIAGRCLDGACATVSCGNGVLEPGEVCDDGNQSGGDGCSGTCTSIEVCGNSVVDTASGEGCDCGSLEATSALCAYPNSADLRAECDLECHPRFCGNGVVDTIEQCDGSAPAGFACQDFGYYDGALACGSVCQVDPTGCSGRCGDDAIDAAFGELCDGAPPPGQSCLDYSNDLGALRCTGACGPSIAACHPLGWATVAGITARIIDTWGGSGRIAYVTNMGEAVVLVDEVPAAAPTTSSYTAIAGTPTTVVAVGAAQIATWTLASGWVAAVAPWSSTYTVIDAWASDSLGVFVSFAETAELWRLTGGTWTQITGSWIAPVHFGQPRTALYLRWDNVQSNVVQWDGSETPIALPSVGYPLLDLAADGTGALWLDYRQGGIYHQTGATWTREPNVTSKSMIFDSSITTVGSVVAMAQNGITYSPEVTVEATLVVPNIQPTRVPWSNGRMVFDGMSRLYTASNGLKTIYGIWTPEGGQPNSYPTANSSPGCRIALVSFAGARVLQSNGTWTTVGSCSRVIVSATDRVYCWNGTELLDGGTSIAVGSVTAMWAAPDDSHAMTVGTNSYAWRATSGWTIATAPRQFTELAGGTFDELFAIADDDADAPPLRRIFHWDGATWIPVTAPMPNLSDLVVTPTYLYATQSGMLVTIDRATMTTTLSAEPTYQSLAGGSTERTMYSRLGGLSHFDGTTWSRLRPPSDSGLGLLEVFDQQLFVTVTQSGSPSFINWYRLQSLHDF